MNDFERRVELDDAVKEQHGVKPKVYRKRISGNEYTILISHNGKDVYINELMDKGLTKRVILTFNGEEKQYKTYIQAENEAISIIKGKDGNS